jgi:Zn-dependent metalloprotease
MCTTHPPRLGLHCILPPFILANIARNAPPELRERALRTLLVDPSIRIRRATIAGPATAGQLARRRRAAGEPSVPTPVRTVFDAEGLAQAPGRTIARREGEPPSGDLAVDEAYDGLGATFDLFWEAYRRDSIDDAGLPLDATVHFGRDYDNAFWDGTQMVFGDGDGELFNRFTVALDIIGHELAHGVIEKEAGLTYYGQPGALNESIADVFGSLVKQRALGQTATEADWLIGEGLFTASVQGRAIRSMSEPGSAYDDPVLGTDPQPGHMDEYVVTAEDNGGVHINSGIANRAFHLAAVAIGGEAWDGAGRVWYHALLDPATRADTEFAAFAETTVAVTAMLYGNEAPERAAVEDAWTTVGVG